MNSQYSPSGLQVDDLTWREQEVLSLLAKRYSNKEVGANLHLAESTVKWYNQQIFAKLGVSTRKQAVDRANELNILTPETEVASQQQIHLLTNLPSSLSSFVGRKKEIEDIKRLLETERLVVLTGAGGAGKTRLALQIATDLVGSIRDGVWIVELADVSEPSLVPNAIAKVLKLNTNSKSSPLETLKRFLPGREIFFLLDNFEHLDSAAPLVGELLANSPNVTMMVTSRARLNIYGEQDYQVGPLSLPDADELDSAESVRAHEAIDLFFQRAKAAQPGLIFDEEQIAAIARVCIRLDGLPLAIELAAPLAKIYGLAPLAERLDEDLGILSAGPLDMPDRQRTLRATMDWSYQLLDEPDKLLFDRLSIFRGGGILEAIEAVCAEGISGNLIDRLASLVEKNLVIPFEAADGEIYFRLLDTLREYGLEHLKSRPGINEYHRKHAAYFAGLAETSSMEIVGSRNSYWFKRLKVENQNLRSALTWSLEGDEPEFGMRMVGSLAYYWYYNGLAAESSPFIDTALEKSEQVDAALRGAVLLTAGRIAYGIGDTDSTDKHLVEALEIHQQLGDELNEGMALLYLALNFLGSKRNSEEAISIGTRALGIFEKRDEIAHIAQAHNLMGEIFRIRGNYKAAKKHYQQSLALCQETGEKIRAAIQYINLGFIAFHEAKYKEADRLNRTGIKFFIELDSHYGMASHLGAFAGPLTPLGFPIHAARLLGASKAQLDVLDIQQQPADQPEIELFINMTKEALGEEYFQKSWQEGSMMNMQEAVSYALSDAD